MWDTFDASCYYANLHIATQEAMVSYTSKRRLGYIMSIIGFVEIFYFLPLDIIELQIFRIPRLETNVMIVTKFLYEPEKSRKTKH